MGEQWRGSAHRDGDNGSFDSGSVQPGQSFGAVFNTSGTYAYHDKEYGGTGGTGMSARSRSRQESGT